MSKRSVVYKSHYKEVTAALAIAKPKATALGAQRLVEVTAGLSAYDTGAASNSWYAKGSQLNTYGDALDRALALNEKVTPVPEIEAPPGDAHSVSHSLLHPFFLELGTVKMAAQPALIPAIDQVASEFGDIVRITLTTEIRKNGNA